MHETFNITVYFKNGNPPVTINKIKEVVVDKKVISPKSLMLSTTDRYNFQGDSNGLVVNGSDIQAIYYEQQ